MQILPLSPCARVQLDTNNYVYTLTLKIIKTDIVTQQKYSNLKNQRGAAYSPLEWYKKGKYLTTICSRSWLETLSEDLL